jgi:FKBP-type peptidyl-prolyl cis-trans isomerase SlyD
MLRTFTKAGRAIMTTGASIAAGKVVSIHYTLKDDDGDVIDSSSGGNPLDYLHGSSNIVPGLEQALAGKGIGEKLTVAVAPGEGYGDRDERGVQVVPRDAFPAEMDIEEGMQLAVESPQGEEVPIWITAIEGDQITVDMNHPLAGVTLHFSVEIVGIRDASAEEVEHGHPHGPGGHHHH